VGTQYHPEYKTRPLKPAPVFLGFILAASGQLTDYFKQDDKRVLGRYDSKIFDEPAEQ
jgi:CTP synthase